MSNNIEAFHDYVKGRHLLRLRGKNVAKSIPFFERAISADPDLVAAHISLALACSMMTGQFDRALPLIEKAMAADPDLAEAHAVRGFYAIYHEWDWEQAERSLERALELDPASVEALHWRGEYRKQRGHFAEAERDLLRALDLDPVSLILHSDLAELYYFARDDQKSVEYAQRALAIDPNYPYANNILGRAYSRLGRDVEAFHHWLEFTVAQRTFRDPAAENEFRRRMTSLFEKGGSKAVRAYRLEGTKLKARFIGRSKLEPDLAISLAKLELRSGNLNAGIDHLASAFASIKENGSKRPFLFLNIAVDPTFDSIRSDERFRQMLREMRL